MAITRKLLRSSLVKDSLIYIGCDGLNKAVPFLLLPLLTHYLHPSDYGLITNFNVYIQIISVICYISTSASLPVMFHKLDKIALSAYVSNIITINTLISIVSGIILVIFSNTVSVNFKIDINYQLAAISIVWLSGVANICMILWRCENKPFKFGLFQILQTVINAGLTIYLVIILLKGWEGRLWSNIISNVIMGVLGLLLLIKKNYFNFNFSKEQTRKILLFAFPLIPHSLSFWLKSGADKILLTNLIGLSANGLYSAAITWGAIVTMFLMSFNNAYSPYLYKQLSAFSADMEGTLGAQKKLVKLIWLALGATFLVVLIVYLISVFLINIIYDSNYQKAADFLPFVMITQFFEGGYLLFACFLHYTMDTRKLGTITFLAGLVQLLLSYLLIKHIGAEGSAISSALISGIVFFLIMVEGIKSFDLPWFNFR